MNHRQNHQRSSRLPRPWDRAYRQSFGRLDAALEKNTRSDNTELMRRMRLANFADVDELPATGLSQLSR